ncbi:GntR family transcriptional regulator [Nocardioides pacificus]
MQIEPPDPASSTPPFEQLRTQIASRVAGGELAPGSRLPTVRALAEQVGLAVNTVARVYRELESDGVIVTEGRRGTFVRSSAGSSSRPVQDACADFIGAARAAGLGVADAVRLVEDGWRT